MEGIKPNCIKRGVTTDVSNSTEHYVPQEILDVADKLYQLIKSTGLDITITVSSKSN